MYTAADTNQRANCRYPAAGSPGYMAFKMYRNYDGEGSDFGDTSVWSQSSNYDRISSYAAVDSKTGSCI
jgi:hypothetical protein